MRQQVRRFSMAIVSVALLALGWGVAAQTRSGNATSETSVGRADLSGIWQAMSTADWNLEAHSSQDGIPGGVSVVEGGDIPYQPWALAQRQKNASESRTADPINQCFKAGVPRATYLPFPFQIVQSDNVVTMLYEYHNMVRIIPTDKSDHTTADVDFWLGDARGHWEGQTLVVDTTNFNDQTWFDRAGNFHSEQLHVVERFTRTDPDHLSYEATIEDPKVFTRPWKIAMPLYRRVEKNIQLIEYECAWFSIERFLRENPK